jgi:hypothetical protein
MHLREIVKKCKVAWTGLFWLRIGTSGGLLRTCYGTFVFSKILEYLKDRWPLKKESAHPY